ncbi:uncharacterized protein LOC8259126 [Ricinus communis]|uniref:Uncharacterized protein n=1 Tax=Ricinus communis TaxID=3988 RepID=B9RU16_RICCO|nr:uncharacterized protein LOC8259126 [Ricinus communis]EEF45135.1 conserved hypothetical protein [Ricinus communis]|eukprot:XP_002517235.1 uncharacterized protein LOC8259126 [Ricinus communis]
MGSSEEERLVQMVQDFIESESSSVPIFPSSSKCLSTEDQAKYFILKEILGRVTEAEAKVLESVLKHMKCKKEAERTSSLKKWLVLRLTLDGFNASICQTTLITSLGCKAGDYEYIDITLKEENGKSIKRVIVDIDFRSQFELARPTLFYKELTETVPSLFVGSEEKLNKIISLLCSAAKQSLTERGLHVPPWRTSTYMQSKWLKVTATTPNYSSNTAEANQSFSIWTPPKPIVKHERRALGGGSALSSQFSTMGINCC